MHFEADYFANAAVYNTNPSPYICKNSSNDASVLVTCTWLENKGYKWEIKNTQTMLNYRAKCIKLC